MISYNKKGNNKGATLVTTIIVIAVVGIFATVALWISLNNYQMKITNQNVTDNFYTAESVLEQIRAGLMTDASTSLEAAYIKVMQNYGASDNVTRNSIFANSYIQNLRGRLRFGATPEDNVDPDFPGSDFLCSKSKLEQYISSDLTLNNKAKIYSADKPSEGYFLMDTTSNAVIIKNIVVEYTDDKGFLSIIQTDIVMGVPDLNLTSAESIPKVFTYSLIGNDGIEVDAVNGLTLNGNVYAGNNFKIYNNSNVVFDKSDYLIVDGDLDITETKFQSNPNGEIWTKNINVTSSKVHLLGDTYVNDDMTLFGDEPYVSFSKDSGDLLKSANYIGYGTSDKGTESSAILINGTSSTLDLSGINSMVLAGNAYISTKRFDSEVNPQGKGDVLLGESIAVKGDQIAYLVPVECIATINGKSMVMQNPITMSQYEMIKTEAAKYEEGVFEWVNTDVIVPKFGTSLNNLLNNEADDEADKVDNDSYKMLFIPSSGDREGLVYFYLKLSPSKASVYFMDYYNADSKKLESYTQFYTKSIKSMRDDAKIYTAGLYPEYEENKLKYNRKAGTDAINGHIGNLPLIYEALTHRLIPEYTTLTAVQKTNSVFYNTIQEEVDDANIIFSLKDFIHYAPIENKKDNTTWEKKDIDLGAGKKGCVVLADGNYTITDSNYIYLVIATGDVTVSSSVTNEFEGTVIAKGNVIIKNNTALTIRNTTTENIKKLLSVECPAYTMGGTTKQPHVYNFFKEGTIYMTFGFGTDEEEGENISSSVSIFDAITYENWKKR